jgi:hypothetical protein
MADSIILQAVGAAIVLLNTDRPDGIPEVSNKRVFPGDPIVESAPRMAVFLGDESIDAPMQSSSQDRMTRRRTAIAVQCAASVDEVEQLDRSVDAMLNWATATLGQTRLGGLVHFCRETGTTRRSEYKEVYTMIATRIFELSFQTRRNDSTVNT